MPLQQLLRTARNWDYPLQSSEQKTETRGKEPARTPSLGVVTSQSKAVKRLCVVVVVGLYCVQHSRPADFETENYQSCEYNSFLRRSLEVKTTSFSVLGVRVWTWMCLHNSGSEIILTE